MENRLITIDSKKLNEVLTDVETFKNQVSTTVNALAEKLPKDLTPTDVSIIDAFDAKSMEVYSKIESKYKELYNNRRVFTSMFDEVKKKFTTPENEVKSKLEELKNISIACNTEKLRRKRVEEEKENQKQLEKQRIIDLEASILKHYSDVALRSFFEMKERTENAFYKMTDPKNLTEFVEKMKGFDESKLKKSFEENRKLDKNKYQLDNVEDLKVMPNLFPKIAEMEKGWINEYVELLNTLTNYLPSRLEQLKEINEDKIKEESELLKKKQDEEKLKSEEAEKQRLENQLHETKIDALTESLEATSNIEMNKGASTKLKYYPGDHKSLLKIIMWYLQNEYQNEDFDMLFKRLSFMRTAADKSLNEGVVIDCVDYKEDVRVRKVK